MQDHALFRWAQQQQAQASAASATEQLDEAGPADTRGAAYREILPHVGGLQAEVLAFLRSVGEAGATDHEIAEHFGGVELKDTYAPRRHELMVLGLVKDSGRRRPTFRNGKRGRCTARVYVVCTAAGD